jgi:hypothetical protein
MCVFYSWMCNTCGADQQFRIWCERRGCVELGYRGQVPRSYNPRCNRCGTVRQHDRGQTFPQLKQYQLKDVDDMMLNKPSIMSPMAYPSFTPINQYPRERLGSQHSRSCQMPLPPRVLNQQSTRPRIPGRQVPDQSQSLQQIPSQPSLSDTQAAFHPMEKPHAQHTAKLDMGSQLQQMRYKRNELVMRLKKETEEAEQAQARRDRNKADRNLVNSWHELMRIFTYENEDRKCECTSGSGNAR